MIDKTYTLPELCAIDICYMPSESLRMVIVNMLLKQYCAGYTSAIFCWSYPIIQPDHFKLIQI